MKFSEGEKVLCFHGPLIYEAKCLKTQDHEKAPKYFIHYAGWNKNWDEWVTEARIMKYNDVNVARQKEVRKQHDVAVKQKRATKKILEKKKLESSKSTKDRSEDRSDQESRSSTPSDRSSGTKRSVSLAEEVEMESDGQDSKKTKLDPDVETEEQFLSHTEIRIKLPDELKPVLVDDWELINRQHKLVVLPARVSVGTILEDYIKTKITSKQNTPNKESALHEVVAGLREYFNVLLGKQLLYTFERAQYADIIKKRDDVPKMTEVYGYIHLVRLFVKMGEMVAFTQLDDKTTVMLNYHLNDFLRFLVKNQSTYYSIQEYCVASAEYQRKS